MGRRVEVVHLVGARDIAARLGLVRVQAVHYLRRVDPSFPQPVYWGLGRRGLVWNWPDVWRWAQRCQRPGIDGSVLPKPERGGRRVDVDDLVGAQQIVDRLGWRHVQRLHAARTEDPAFPPPVFGSAEDLWGKRVWAWPDVWRWAKGSRRRFGVELGSSPASLAPRA